MGWNGKAGTAGVYGASPSLGVATPEEAQARPGQRRCTKAQEAARVGGLGPRRGIMFHVGGVGSQGRVDPFQSSAGGGSDCSSAWLRCDGSPFDGVSLCATVDGAATHPSWFLFGSE